MQLMICIKEYLNPDKTWWELPVLKGQKVLTSYEGIHNGEKILGIFLDIENPEDGDGFVMPEEDLKTHFISMEEYRDKQLNKVL